MKLPERWTSLSKRERYLILAAVTVALAVAGRYAPFVPMISFEEQGPDATWVRMQKVKNFHRIIGRSDAVTARTRAIETRYKAAGKRLIEGVTPTQVGAELQGRLSQMAGDAGLNVLSSQILKPEDVEEFRRVGVRMTLSGELDGMARMVSSVESDRKDLAVTLLEINRKLGASRRPTPTRASSSKPPAAPLTATMEIKTLMPSSS
ncbi:MAG: type II secretion system protein GspM [Deltaproteobacteria bacterium]